MAFNLMMVLVDLTYLLVAVVIVCLRGWNDDALMIVVMDRASGRVWTLMFVIVDCFRVCEGAWDTRWSLRWTDARSRAEMQKSLLATAVTVVVAKDWSPSVNPTCCLCQLSTR